MLVPSPTQATAVRAWLLAALNTDDLGAPIVPPLFTDTQVFLGERNHPRSPRFARIATVAINSRGIHRRYVVSDLGGPAQSLTEERGQHREWVTSVTVATPLDLAAPALVDTAGVILQRALGAFESPAATWPMAEFGISPLRHAEIQDVARLTGAEEWETRCSVVLTWLCGWTASTPVEWVEQVRGQGDVGLGPLPFDSDLGA